MKITRIDILINGFRDSKDIWEGPEVELAVREIMQLRKQVDSLNYELLESNSLLRSAFQIAKRDGKDTNWEAWRKQLDIALVRQHKLMYEKENEEE